MTNFVGLAAELRARAAEKGPVTIGLAGAGQMGTDIVVQAGLMPGVRIGAVPRRQADMVPLDHPVAECVTVAKRDLAPGQTLEAIGLHDYRGFAMTWEDARAEGAIPLGLAEKAKVTKPIRAGEKLTYANCTPNDSLVVTQIRKRLDQSDARFLTAEPARRSA